ncbi:MAG: hypothetical protein LBC79_10775 [Deltaproteobacteria bacterium]|nr:hypothetical protein [Deltaproteobacteria bacterium]
MNEPAKRKKFDISIQSNPETGAVVKVENLELTPEDMNTMMVQLKKFVSENPGKCVLAGLLIGTFLLDNGSDNIENPVQGKLMS